MSAIERPTPGGNAGARAARELAEVQRQVEAARAVLVRLLQDVVEAEGRLQGTQSSHLVEVNERLVIAALRAQSDAVATALALDEATQSAQLDPLTQLPNRTLLLDRFAHAIAGARRHGDRLALLFLDLDNFKQINDRLGHAVGDQVLRRVARCLQASVRAADTVSRHGGDEFLILLTEVAQPTDAALIADKVIAAVGALGYDGEQPLLLGASVGISLYPDDGEDAATLIDRADAAMYHAKRYALGSYSFRGAGPDGVPAEEPPADIARRHSASSFARALAEHERRHAQLREANEQLVLAALGAKELQEAAEQAQRRQAEFLKVVAQELHDPQAPIRIATAMLGRVRAAEPLLPRMQALVGRQLANLSRWIDERLGTALAGTGPVPLEDVPVDLRGLVERAVEAVGPVMQARRQRMKVDLPSAALEIDGDAARLGQMLGNLLDNATKYTADGGEVGVSLHAAAGAAEITVRDNGIGIAAETLDHVFDPFVQEERAIGFNGVGIGLGLTVVRQVVEAHGGRVVARSAGIGLGSEFVVTLPLARRPPIAA